MKGHLTNAACGIIDYAAYPVGMLLVAPVVLHHLGLAEYGIWTVATAAVSAGGIIASGFGDANIQHVAKLRILGDKRALKNAVRCMVGINLTLGTVLALIGWLLAPYAASCISSSDVMQQHVCLLSLRIASVLMLVRALESVCISTQRAFERYGAAVLISVCARLLALIAAAVLAYTGHGTGSIMEATAILLVAGTWGQFLQLGKFLGVTSFWPAFDRTTTNALFGFGIYSWLQTIAGVVFGQVDRLLLGVSLGAAAVASYALCVQLAQPIFGLTAAGLHFMFPYLSGRVSLLSKAEMRRTLLRTFSINLLFVCIGTVLLLVFGNSVLRAWAGVVAAQSAAPIFPLIVIGSALLGLSVTGTYALLAAGLVRTVAWLSLAGGTAMLLMMWWLLPHSGLHGLAISRLFYGLFSLLLYLPLIHWVTRGSDAAVPKALIHDLGELEEVSQL